MVYFNFTHGRMKETASSKTSSEFYDVHKEKEIKMDTWNSDFPLLFPRVKLNHIYKVTVSNIALSHSLTHMHTRVDNKPS